jgi:hypothetical protein
MIKRKWLAGLLTGALALGTITGCGSTPAESKNDTTAVVDIEEDAKQHHRHTVLLGVENFFFHWIIPPLISK